VVNVTLNGESRELPDGTTVAEVLMLIGRGPRGVAVALNEEVVPRGEWSGTRLVDGDRVEILAAAQGG
jgi:sulfur carrier protein